MKTKYFIIAGMIFALILVAAVALIQRSSSRKETGVNTNITPTAKPEVTTNSETMKKYNPQNVPTDILIKQAQKEEKYAEAEKAIMDNFPWLDKLPIRDSSYFVYFDTKTKHFIFKYINVPTEQISTVRKTIMNRLVQLGIPVGSYPITDKH